MNEAVSNVRRALADIDELWSPRPLARINDYAVKAVRVQGEFVWHRHTATDELFLVVSGELEIHLRDADGEWQVSLDTEDVFVVPRGVEHRPVSRHGAELLLLEPADTVNTGDAPERESSETPYADARVGARREGVR
jgi:mannose-6-phosphate isomerase-like protein (cupin superfamily)